VSARVSPQKRLKAARLIRQDAPVAAVHRETGISERTLWRWLREDEDFIMLVHGAGTLQVGPVRIVVAHDAPLLDQAPDESIVWIARTGENGEPEVLGSVHVEDASHLRAVFVADLQRARASLQPAGSRTIRRPRRSRSAPTRCPRLPIPRSSLFCAA
jgi:hypothetical protein